MLYRWFTAVSVLRLFVALLALGAGTAARASDVEVEAPDDDNVFDGAAIAGGAIAGGLTGLVVGTTAAIVVSANTVDTAFLDGQTGGIIVGASILGGAFVGGVAAGAVVGEPLLGVGGGVGAALGLALPTTMVSLAVASVGTPEGWGVYILPFLGVLALPPTLSLMGAGALLGSLSGTCVAGDCSALRGMVGVAPDDDNAVFAARFAPIAAEGGACAGCLVGGLVSLATINPSNSVALFSTVIGAPMVGAFVGGTLGGVIAGDVGTGALAGAGGALGVGGSVALAAGVVGLGALSTVMVDNDVARTLAFAPLALAPVITGVALIAPLGGSALLVCMARPEACSMVPDDKHDE